MSSNSELQQNVMDELLWDPCINAEHIGVTAKDGIVTLTGYVSNYFEKKKCERVAKRVANVKIVVDELDIRLSGSAERTDLEIAESALETLKLNVLIPRDGVQLTVDSGRIVLEGEVDWQYQSNAAEESLHNMVGVKGIINKIRIKPSVRPADVKARIQSALVRNAQIDASHIRVETSGGKATLSGHVRNWSEKEQAEAAAWSAPGITEVVNNVEIEA